MPDLLTPQTLAAAGPLIFETFVKHFLTHRKDDDENENAAKGDLLFDEAFVMAKTFLEIATKHPVAAIQRFGLTRTPSPPWVAVHRVIIGQNRLTPAAEFLVTALGGEDMAYKIAGGTKWWQVRAGPGVEAEWIVLKKDWKQYVDELDKGNAAEMPGGGTEDRDEALADDTGLMGENGGTNEEGEFLPEMDKLRCMFFIHGGAYYWGSINTHRYVLWRLARKMRGRCFAVNYRKAPQYPFPCALQDCLAAWLYLVNPPPEAKHHPVDPKNIIIAGDSAGGGLTLAMLQILRDTPGLELPAGAVLMSPWSDLTHSFPSILQNTATDVVPPYSFIHKPSSLWPPPPPDLSDEMQNRLKLRVNEAVARMRNNKNLADMLARRASHISDNENAGSTEQTVGKDDKALKSSDPDGGVSTSKDHSRMRSLSFLQNRTGDHPEPKEEPTNVPDRANPAALFDELGERVDDVADSGLRSTTLARCYEPLRLHVKDQDVVVDSQIQLYATNGQLCHPFVSPALGYMGGLPPLYILAGNNEVLRDEIIYVAHKAAHPERHPIREDVKKLLPSLQGVEDRYLPTNVHLQVYDGVCHDLPLFSFTKPARGAYRAIAAFCRYVTPSAPASLSISHDAEDNGERQGSAKLDLGLGDPIQASPNASPDLTPVHSGVDLTRLAEDASNPSTRSHTPVRPGSRSRVDVSESAVASTPSTPATPSHPHKSLTSSLRFRFLHKSASRSEPSVSSEVVEHERTPSQRPTRSPNPQTDREPTGDDAGPRFGQDPADQDSKALPGTAGHSGIYRGAHPFTDHMIRERVAVDGTCRPLEPESELDAMTMPVDEIGFIKEGPAIRYMNGQALWDKKFRHAKKTIAKHRQRNLKNSSEHDARRLVKFWQEKMRSHDEEVEAERRLRADEADGVWSDIEEAVEGGSQAGEGGEAGEAGGKGRTSEEKMGRRERRRRSGREKLLLDQSWSWTWALKGEAPPPSAIVSRRDFTEARHLALMADRMDDQRQTEVHGLSIWVGLASFFSNSQERTRARQAFEDARRAQKAVNKAGKEKEKETFPTSRGEERVVKNGTVRKIGGLLGLKKKSLADPAMPMSD